MSEDHYNKLYITVTKQAKKQQSRNKAVDSEFSPKKKMAQTFEKRWMSSFSQIKQKAHERGEKRIAQLPLKTDASTICPFTTLYHIEPPQRCFKQLNRDFKNEVLKYTYEIEKTFGSNPKRRFIIEEYHNKTFK